MPILHPLAARLFVRFWVAGEAMFPKMGDSLTRTPMNLRAKFDTASFIVAGEFRNRTNTQKTNKQKTKKQTVNDISTPCLSVCVDLKNAATPCGLIMTPSKLCRTITNTICGYSCNSATTTTRHRSHRASRHLFADLVVRLVLGQTPQ